MRSIGRSGRSIDQLLVALGVMQVALLIGKLADHKAGPHIPWWVVFIPAYPVIGALLLIVFGVFAAGRK